MRRSLACVMSLLVLALPAAGQDLTDDQLLNLFRTQRDAFVAARGSGLGKARGLTLVTVDPATTAPEAGQAPLVPLPLAEGGQTAAAIGAQPGKPAAAAGQSLPALAQPAAPDAAAVALSGETTVQPVVFGELAPELQVNVNIQFGFDSAALGDDQKPRLAQLCSVMKKSDISLFRIVGHTDAAGSDSYNQKLSLLRAQEVRRHLISDCGIEATRLEAMGVGEKFLANSADPKAAINRRVEFQALS